ncbi:MAG TPA: glycosyltransferase family 9 protein [Verrucomicrobiae bacterium]
MNLSGLSTFYDCTRKATKILIVDFGFLGDSLHLLPALWEINSHYPQAELHVLTSELGAEVLRLAPCVHHAWGLNLEPSSRTLSSQWELIRRIRSHRFDLAFNFSGSDRTIIWTGLSGARQSIAHQRGRLHFWNRWLIPHWVSKQNPDLPVFEQHRQMLAACGFTLSKPRFDIEISSDDQSWAESQIPKNAIHLSINSAVPLKEWPLNYYAELSRDLLECCPEMRIIASAGSKTREKERLRHLAQLLKDDRLLILEQNLSIPRLASVLNGCALHIGPDSGVLHLAMVLGVRTISFFRDGPGTLGWLPRGPGHKVFLMPCRCRQGDSFSCATERAECLASLQPRQVLEAALEQLRFAENCPR